MATQPKLSTDVTDYDSRLHDSGHSYMLFTVKAQDFMVSVPSIKIVKVEI